MFRSDDFESLGLGWWVVFSGRFDTQKRAADALDGIGVADAYVRRVA